MSEIENQEPMSAEEPAAEPQAAAPATAPKNPILAAVLSAFPGLGHVYNGLYLRGITFFLIIVALIHMTTEGEGLMGFAIAFFWLFNIIDAYRQATLINYGYAQDLGITDKPKLPLSSQGGLWAGAILFLIGVYALAERYVYIDLDWIFDLWPVLFMAIGAWLIWGTIRERKKRRDESEGMEGEY